MTFYVLLIARLDADSQLFIGTGYVRFVYKGLEFHEWLLVPWQVEDIEQESNEELEE